VKGPETMSVKPAAAAPMGASSAETPSGKGPGDENFPVGSLLIAVDLRPHVLCYYGFARAIDDIADNPDLASDEKIRRLDAFEAALRDAAELAPGFEKAAALRQSLDETGVPDRHARDLVAAFRQDAVKLRYRNWNELVGYCELSANPVGRFLLDLHGESPEAVPASDALCTALQVLNHLQDCGEDYRRLDRVYLPMDWMDAAGAQVEDLAGSALTPGLRRVLDFVLAECDTLLAQAAALPPRLRSRRLAAESAVIIALARRISARLKREDPLAGRVALSKPAMVVVGAAAGLRSLAQSSFPSTGRRT